MGYYCKFHNCKNPTQSIDLTENGCYLCIRQTVALIANRISNPNKANKLYFIFKASSN